VTVIPDPPRGLKAIPWRLPIWLYRLHLGWLLGHRALLLTHTGRISGKARMAVLEVVKYDKDTNTHYVASGFGEKSDWYQNIIKNPNVTIQSAGQKVSVHAQRLPLDQSRKVFQEYTREHPNAIKNLAKLVGYKIDHTEEGLQDFLDSIPLIAFCPKSASDKQV
jgi:deazaflavin-dependent oxidoreductase (nitroreductase family)